MSLSAARSRVSLARDHLNANHVDEVAPLLNAAVVFLVEVAFEEKVPLLAEIVRLRTELDNTPNSDDVRSLAAARSQLRYARSEFEAGRGRDAVERSLDEALEYLSNARERFHAPILAEVASLRGQLDGVTSSTSG